MKKHRFSYNPMGIPDNDVEIRSLIVRSTFIKSSWNEDFSFKFVYETTNIEALNYMLIKRPDVLRIIDYV